MNKQIHPNCVKCGKEIPNSLNLSRKYCYSCRQEMLKEWGKNGTTE